MLIRDRSQSPSAMALQPSFQAAVASHHQRKHEDKWGGGVEEKDLSLAVECTERHYKQ